MASGDGQVAEEVWRILAHLQDKGVPRARELADAEKPSIGLIQLELDQHYPNFFLFLLGSC
jgi:hypothetical protein